MCLFLHFEKIKFKPVFVSIWPDYIAREFLSCVIDDWNRPREEFFADGFDLAHVQS